MRVALVCRDNETVADLLQRLDASLGKALAENTVVDEVLPEIKRRRGLLTWTPATLNGPGPHAYHQSASGPIVAIGAARRCERGIASTDYQRRRIISGARAG